MPERSRLAPAVAPADHGGRWAAHVLGEEFFKAALIRERTRSDRSNRPFALLLVEVTQAVRCIGSSVSASVMDALVAAKRDTDVAGWIDAQALLGLMVPEIRPNELSATCSGIEGRFRRELALRLAPEVVATISIRPHVYPEARGGGAEGAWPVDATFYPERGRRHAQAVSYELVKRGVDIVCSLTLLLLLSPLLMAIAALVKLSSRGPVIFRQARIGQMTRPFTMFKFRTMYTGADPQLHREFVQSFIKANGTDPQPGKEGFFKLTNDPRITSVGRILRSTSLDELPQLWNVLRGDMSLVGPRPPLPYELNDYEHWHRRRVLEARPGLTGLWQVTGRSRTTFDEMVRLDLQYARRRSLWTDIKILFGTPRAVISGKGAC
jgi:lipopolysaccharide/colanic/teichoic acid biosynthesis glycosyltransferase